MIVKPKFSDSQILKFCIGTSPNTPGKANAHRCSLKEFWETITSAGVKAVCDKLPGLSDKNQRQKAKKNLPVFCFNAAVFRNNHRTKEDALPNGLAMFDIDGVSNPIEIHERLKDRYKDLKIDLAHISASGTGLHFVFELQPGESIEEGSKRMGDTIGITDFDKACKDASRASYAVDIDKFLYIDWANLIVDYATIEQQDKMLETMTDTSNVKKEKDPNGVAKRDTITEPETHDDIEQETYDGIALTEIWKAILTELLHLKEVPSEGTRNNTLFKAAIFMRYCCNFMYSTLRKVVDTWGLPEDEVATTLRSALEQKRSQSDLARMEKLIRDLKQQRTAPEKNNVNNTMNRAIQAYQALPPMPDVKMPRLFQLLFKLFPEQFKAQVFFVATSMCGVLLTALRLKSNDAEREELPILPVIVEGPLGSGKSFIDALIKIVLAPLIKEEDMENAKFEQWQSECESISSNKDKPKKPKNRSRLCHGDFTNAALNDMMFNTFHQICLIFSEEMDTIKRSCGNRFENITDLLRKGFDGARSGQRRVSASSVNGSTETRLNFIFAVTPNSRRKLISNSEDGTVSRVCFTSMDPTPGQKRPKYGSLTPKERAEMNMIVEALWRVGLKPAEEIAELERRMNDKSQIVLPSEQVIRDDIYVKLPRLTKMIDEFEQERIDNYKINGSVSADTFSHRIPQMMLRIGMVLYWLYGKKETNEMLELTRWAGNRILQEVLDRYGNDYDDAYASNIVQQTSYIRLGHNLDCLKSIPKEFTREDIRSYRLSHGLTSDNNEENCINVMIHRMMKDQRIEKIAENTWRQLPS